MYRFPVAAKQITPNLKQQKLETQPFIFANMSVGQPDGLVMPGQAWLILAGSLMLGSARVSWLTQDGLICVSGGGSLLGVGAAGLAQAYSCDIWAGQCGRALEG